MLATVTWQGDGVQLEQSDMGLALNVAKIAKVGFPHTTIKETQDQIKIPHVDVKESRKQGVQFVGHRNLKDGFERHPAMCCENQTCGCLHCHNCTTPHGQICWRYNGLIVPPPS